MNKANSIEISVPFNREALKEGVRAHEYDVDNMRTTYEEYIEVGRMAARAISVGDQATADFHKRHFQKVRDLEECVEDRRTAQAQYNMGYRAAREANMRHSMRSGGLVR
jgi:fructose-1,6-bisphosphatase